MFKVLIVDDVEDTLDQLKKYFTEAFPEAAVETALTVADARRLIEKAYGDKRPYHAVALDFMLPPDHLGQAPLPDVTLCRLLKDLRWPTVVAHMTSHPEDADVRRHIKEAHVEQINPWAFALSKRDDDFAEQLVSRLKAFLYAHRIEERMSRLFGAETNYVSPARARFSGGYNNGARSVTHELAALCREIGLHWTDLDEDFRRKLSEVFKVDTESSPVRVSLL